MATLTEATIWEPGIYQLEETDPVMGGANGIDNLQAKQLAARTNFLNTAIASEATARTAADNAEIARANNAYVKQGTGIGQTNSLVAIGWSAAYRLKATVDTTDLGNLVTDTTGDLRYLPIAGNPAQVVSVAAPTADGHAVRIVGYANFSVSSGVLTVHKQVGMSLTRGAAGLFSFRFDVAQSGANWTSAVNHVRSTTNANTGESIENRSSIGGTLLFVEGGVFVDPAATAANASSIIIFAA